MVLRINQKIIPEIFSIGLCPRVSKVTVIDTPPYLSSFKITLFMVSGLKMGNYSSDLIWSTWRILKVSRFSFQQSETPTIMTNYSSILSRHTLQLNSKINAYMTFFLILPEPLESEFSKKWLWDNFCFGQEFWLHSITIMSVFRFPGKNLYNNKCIVTAVLALGGPMRACDSSLEPSCHKNDHVINLFWFARAARPQRAKMCFYYIS